MGSNFMFLVLVLPLSLFSQEKRVETTVAGPLISYEKVKSPEAGMGVIGSEDRKAFASFIEGSADKMQNNFYSIKFKSINFSKKPAQIYLCIYEDDNGLPGNIIVKGKILISVPAKQNIVSVDLSHLNIEVPRKGYFVGFEWILNKKNKISGNTKNSIYPYNPTISGITGKDVNLYIYDGQWKKSQNSEIVTGIALDIVELKRTD